MECTMGLYTMYFYVPIPQVSKSVLSFCKVNLIALSLGACWLLFLAEIPWMMLICSISSSNRSRYLCTTEQCMKTDEKYCPTFSGGILHIEKCLSLRKSTCTSEMSYPQKGFLCNTKWFYTAIVHHLVNLPESDQMKVDPIMHFSVVF